MADIKKVVKELEERIKVAEECMGNPMFTPDAIRTIVALLKEQEAVKPKSKSRHGQYPQIVHRCGNCNEILYKYYKFCPTCGRAVKWET